YKPTLVVLHHIVLVYLDFPFYYSEPADEDLSGLFFWVFVTLNQGWFMGSLFLLAGYFTPDSFHRKGLKAFLLGKLIRLGIPLFVYIFVLHPPLLYFAYQVSGNTPEKVTSLLDDGVLWFVTMLLVFDFGYAAWRMLRKGDGSPAQIKASPPRYLEIILFIIGLALATYLFRFVIPQGSPVLGFPTLHYFPQYLSFFILGIVAYYRDWLRTLPNSKGIAGFLITMIGLVFLIMPFGYLFWDSIFGVGMVLMMITLFRRFLNSRGKRGRFLANHSYGVYILHAHVITLVTYSLRVLDTDISLKVILASIIGVPLSFMAAYLVRKILGVSRAV
ncbi:MAG: acyltransferase family protein, partial [Leptolyngbya sp. SIO1D8]|nr:acyltransferase family protein [Leptolyngbya sp. SIO1D8]